MNKTFKKVSSYQQTILSLITITSMDILKTKAQIHATNIWTRIKPRKRTVLGGAIILIIVGYFIVKGSNSTPVVTPKIGTVVSGDVINSIKVI